MLFSCRSDNTSMPNCVFIVYTKAHEISGGLKAELLRNLLYSDLGVEITAHSQELTERNVKKLLTGSSIVTDVFDNASSRAVLAHYCRINNINCLHAGVNDQFGEVRWNEDYVLPTGIGEDVCDYPLTRNLAMLVSVVASETVIRFLRDGTKQDFTVTLGDLKICAVDKIVSIT